MTLASLAFVLSATALFAAAQQPGSTPGTQEKTAPAASVPVQYTLDLTHPANHLAHVSVLYDAALPQTDFQLPAWYPGRYAIYNFAVNVQDTAAHCQAGASPSSSDPALPFARLDPNTWRVENGACRRIRFEYRVFGNTLNGSFFQVDGTHANLNGGPVYMYVVDDRGHHKADPVTLDLQLPSGWKVLNELGDLNQAHIAFPNYDIFIDAPTEAGPDFTVETFTQAGKTYRVMIRDCVTAATNADNRGQLIDGLKKIVAAEAAVIGPDDLDRYTFFFNFDPSGGADGMEHLFGTQIIVTSGLGTLAGLNGAFSDAAHEFFHQWNIKRIRPAALGPWDYTRANPTPSLWVGEGFTQYYGDITLERVGMEDSGAYLQGLARSMGNSLNGAAYRQTSAEAASLTAWFHDAVTLTQESNSAVTWFSYYTRGEQIAAALDLDIRRRSHNQRTLNDAMKWLWDNTYQAPQRATYYLPGRGYTDLDVQHAAEFAAGGGTSYADFFRDYVAGTQPIPYNDYLSAAGLELQCTVPDGVANYTGIAGGGRGGNTVPALDPGSPAENAGIGTGDEIQSVNGTPVENPASEPTGRIGFTAGRGGPTRGNGLALIAALPPNQPATIVVERHYKTATITLTPEVPRATACTAADLPNITSEQKQLRAQWLGH